MRLQLLYDRDVEPFDVPENCGWRAALRLWQRLRDTQKVQCEEADTGRLSDEQRREGYSWAASCASLRHYVVGSVFGSARKGGGRHFGREVPALLVYEPEGERPTDVHPHRKGGSSVTVHSYLASLLRDLN